MVNHLTGGMFRRLIGAWEQLQAALGKLHGSAAIRPNHVGEAIVPLKSEPDRVWFEVRPCVMKIPDQGRASADLFVVVQGLLAFGSDAFVKDGRLVTKSFSTEVAYFTVSDRTLTHVFGVHYDFSASQLGHPAFHAQLKSFVGFASSVIDRYRTPAENGIYDSMRGILGHVRVPSAQMDAFAVFVQVCADHLLHAGSAYEEKAAFNTLLQQTATMRGAADDVPRLQTAAATRCYRSCHWYPQLS